MGFAVLGRFIAIIYTRDDFFGFLFANQLSLLKMDLFYKEIICSQEEHFFPFRVYPLSKGANNFFKSRLL